MNTQRFFQWGMILSLIAFSVSSCGKKQITPIRSAINSCAPQTLSQITDSKGYAEVFVVDPMSASRNLTLTATSDLLDQFRTPVNLMNLSGQGVLSGKYVDVLNGLECNFKFGAYSLNNQFTYLHSDKRFQEAMAYYYSDAFRSFIDRSGYIATQGPVNVVAHCEQGDNSYFIRNRTAEGTVELVCLYDSVRTKGAYYGDDAQVILHELQHATTEDNYSLHQDLNQFYYDEAGALNEAISDFMSLIYSDEVLPTDFPLDPRIFSRWALGTFDPNASHLRGAHKCPVYDSHFPNCDRFPTFELPTSENGNSVTISYVYPDGLGWPFPNNYGGTMAIPDIAQKFKSQEEIHNAGVLLVGALWDVFSAIKSNHSSDLKFTQTSMTQLVMETIRHLPLPNSTTNHSPVTYMGFSNLLVTLADQFPAFTNEDKAGIKLALAGRGLYAAESINDPDWMSVGSGTNIAIPATPNPGIYVIDDSKILRRWLIDLSRDPSIVTNNVENGINSQLEPGVVAAVWFDIQNNSPITAGGVLVTVTSNDPDLTILDSLYNPGYLSDSGLNRTQVMYGKINGTSIVSSLNIANNPSSIPIGNSYFKTNFAFSRTPTTAVWIKINPGASHGKIIPITVQATPSNGVSSTQEFSIVLR